MIQPDDCSYYNFDSEYRPRHRLLHLDPEIVEYCHLIRPLQLFQQALYKSCDFQSLIFYSEQVLDSYWDNFGPSL